MVKPTQERETRALTEAQSITIGDGTWVGDDDVDFDGGGTNGGGGMITPPAAESLVVISDSEGDYGGEIDLDFSEATWWDITLTGDVTFTISNAPASGTVGLLSVILRQGGSGSYTVTWPAEVEWRDDDGTDGGDPPTLSTAVGARDLILLITEDGGTSYGGSFDGGGSALEVLDEGVSLTTSPTSIDFVGAGVTATAVADAVTVTISAAGSHILLADGHATPFTFNDMLQMDDGSDFMWSDPE